MTFFCWMFDVHYVQNDARTKCKEFDLYKQGDFVT